MKIFFLVQVGSNGWQAKRSLSKLAISVFLVLYFSLQTLGMETEEYKCSSQHEEVRLEMGKSKKINAKGIAKVGVSDKKIAFFSKDPLSNNLYLFAKNVGQTCLLIERISYPNTQYLNLVVSSKKFKAKKAKRHSEKNGPEAQKTLEIPGWD